MLPESTPLTSIPPLRHQLPRFFQLASKLVAAEVGTGQQVIVKLATEVGLHRIKELTDTQLDDGASDEQRASALKESGFFLFQAVSNEDVVSSLVLENAVDTIYNFLFGPSGRRAIRLFTAVASTLPALMVQLGDRRLAYVEASLGVLQKIIELNGTALILPEFNSIVQAISGSLAAHEELLDGPLKQRVDQRQAQISRRLQLGREIPSVKVPAQKEPRPQLVIETTQEGPGQLSASGPRHDNDHEGIERIKIMPTIQEIQSHRSDYLPVRDPSRWHRQGIRGLLDRHFRLLREDTVGQLRDAVGITIERLRAPEQSSSSGSKSKPKQGPRIIVYDHVSLVDVSLVKWKGLQFLLELEQPSAVKNMTIAQRQNWWSTSKQLQVGALVCLIDPRGEIIFFSVTEKPENNAEQEMDPFQAPPSPKIRNIFSHPHRAFVLLQLVDADRADIVRALQHVMSHGLSGRRLLEFPGILLPSFRPTLQALQDMSRRADVPFADLLAPPPTHPFDDAHSHVPPPTYALQPGFRFDLSCLMTDGQRHLSLSVAEPFDVESLRQGSTLDGTQSTALVDALSRSLALIQGPPGTGKSFTGVALIKVLLSNRDRARLGPIICVCYTNHALDQLLEHLLLGGTNRIVRLGSRSKSALLEPLNLRNVTQLWDKTKTEKHQEWELRSSMDGYSRAIDNLLDELRQARSKSSIKSYLKWSQPQHHNELFGHDSDGFQTVTHGNPINKWLHRNPPNALRGGTVRPLETLRISGLYEMSQLERQQLYDSWVAGIRDDLHDRICGTMQVYESIRDALDKSRQERELRCLRGAHVIGVTTTGLARNKDILRRLPSRVMLCEEAGEVLEAHTITALLPGIEHAILIGDHQQLRPQIQNYELQHDNPRGAQYSLDVSLFERLVDPPKDDDVRIPFSVLETQRRMHPSIARLVRNTLYPNLQDHPSVHEFPEVSGMRKRLFWLDHQVYEAHMNTGEGIATSHSNDFEVEMVAALVSHLVRQGTYRGIDIAVLTPYLGQLQKLRNRLAVSHEVILGDRDVEDLEKDGLDVEASTKPAITRKTTLAQAVRIATVDNFQGEEANVIVISLVRSNTQRQCGFLKTSNRINVLLSRARHGMYIIGNAQMCRNVEMWAGVLSMLEKDNEIGRKLPLRCSRHPDTIIEVSSPDDFSRLAPEGGCNQKCGLRLSCGHACVNRCHSDLLHSTVVCMEPCPRSKQGCDHACPRACGRPCGNNCHVRVADVLLLCGHVRARLECYLAQDLSLVQCRELVPRTISGCDHTIRIPCHIDPTSDEFACEATCGALLPCGHACLGTCKDCNIIKDGKIVEQNHGPCQCGHQCPSICGETCPDSKYCQVCATDAIKGMTVDYIMQETYGEVNLEEDPIIVPSCGHLMTRSSMDGHMGMIDYYELADVDDPSTIRSLKPLPAAFSMKNLKNCPMCRGPLRDINRYNRIVRQGLLEEATKKFLTWASRQYTPLEESLHREEQQLQESAERFFSDPTREQDVVVARSLVRDGIWLKESPSDQMKTIRQIPAMNARYQPILAVRGAIATFLKQVSEEEQPFGRVFDMLRDLRRKRGGDLNFNMIVDRDMLNTRNRMLALVLSIRCDLAIVSDFLTFYRRPHEKGLIEDVLRRSMQFPHWTEATLHTDFSRNRQLCTDLIKEALARDQPMHEVEARVFFARWCILERSSWSSTGIEKAQTLLEEAKEQLSLAKITCEKYPGQTRGMLSEITAVEEMILKDTAFYTSVSNEEKRQVYAAMALEFTGTGHWYTCANGHPFTIGNCGMPMMTSVCPQCGATVGGEDHELGEGVRHAWEFEEQFGGLRLE
ncbi:MAG: hypothetical protein M1823_004133 [Watsoniomyces obsoletus]|nr:MAG: hypothetical protein M1823_004133 [Watsoniomyces obsoletus]